MPFGNFFGKIYGRLEDYFYGVLDFFENKGIPVYNVAEFLEKKGIPAFPFTVGIVLLLVLAIWGFVFLAPETSTLNVSFYDSSTQTVLNGVSFSLENSSGTVLYGSTIGSGETIELKGVRIGEYLNARASKQGFEEELVQIQVKGKEFSERIDLVKESTIIEGRIRLFDSQTQDSVEDASAYISFEGETVAGIQQADGSFSFAGIPQGKDVLLTVTADNYEDSQQSLKFDESIKSVFLNSKPSASGKTSLILRIYDDATGELIKGARIQVYDRSNGTELTDEIDEDGEFLIQLDEGKSIRWTVEKEGYKSYDSSSEGIQLTLRGEETVKEVRLKKGGERLFVSVTDEGGNVQSSAVVSLYNEAGEVIDSNATDFGGFVEFYGLKADSKYYVGAFKEGFLPKAVEVDPTAAKDVTISLKQVSSSSASSLSIYVSDSKGNAVAGATLQFFEVIGDKNIPLGIPVQEADSAGYFGTSAEIGKTILVKAEKDTFSGDGVVTIETGILNRLDITAYAPSRIVSLSFLDDEGNPLTEGHVVIETESGAVLFDGLIEEGVVFDSLGNKYVKVLVESGGKNYEESVYVEGIDEKTVSFAETDAPENAPSISFERIEDAKGNTVNAVSAGKDYYLVFQIGFPENSEKVGMHVRVGNDGVSNVEGQNIGILGFNADPDSFYYGRTYNELPSPGFESIDFSNKGKEGSFNKWIELYWSNPKGVETVKIRVKERKTVEEAEEEIHFRAWNNVSGTFYRNPEDSLLGEEEYNQSQSGLYAETLNETVKVLESSGTCEEALCASFKFFDSGNSEFEEKDFSAAVGSIYALQIELIGKDEEAAVKVSTSKENPHVSLTGIEAEPFSEFADSETVQTQQEMQVFAQKDKGERIRAYFKALDEENSFIKVQVVSGEDVLNKTLNFKNYAEKEMQVSITPSTVLQGQNFTVIARDDKGNGIQEAKVVVRDSEGKDLKTIIGNASSGKGLNGRYSVKNSFNAGEYELIVEAKGFKKVSQTLSIAREDVLSLPETVSIFIQEEEQSAQAEIDLRNKSSSLVDSIEVEQVKDSSFSEDFELEVSAPVSLQAKSSQKIVLTGKYFGESERDHAELDLIVRGKTENGSVVAETQVLLEYNKEFDSSCLEFSQKALAVTMLSEQGSAKQVSFTAANKCGVTISLIPEVVAEGFEDSELLVNSQDILLDDGKEMDVRVDVLNNIERLGYDQRNFDYTIYYRSNSLTKSIPLNVSLWNKRFSIQVQDTINIYLTQNQKGEKAQTQYPLFIRSAGNTDITNLTISPGPGYTEGISLEVFPAEGYPLLRAGTSAFPPATIVATSNVEQSTTARQILSISGSIDGKRYTLREINVFVHANSPSCLKVNTDKVVFQSEVTGEGKADTQSISLTNNCLGSVAISGIYPRNIGRNFFTLAPSSGFSATIPQGRTERINLVLTKTQEYTTTQNIVLYGVILQTGSRIQTEPITVEVNFGKSAREEGLTLTEADVKVCGTDTTRKVKFPKIAKSGEDCSEGYCDAEQLAVFLAKKIDDKVEEFETKINQKNKDAAVCTSGLCLFSDFGVSNESFTVYLQNDNLSPDLLRHIIDNDKYGKIKGFRTDYSGSDLSSDVITAAANRGYGRAIYIPHFSGCGKYRVRIDGATERTGNTVELGRETIAVSFVEARNQTAECNANKVENFLNFLPVDSGISTGISRSAWLGVVSSNDSELNEVGKKIAARLFGKEERFYSGSGFNRLLLEQGIVSQGILGIEMPSSSDARAPVTITATIKESLLEDRETEDVALEASKTIASLKESSPGKNLCISETGDAMYLQPAESTFGELKISGCVEEYVVEEETKAKAPANELRLHASLESKCKFYVFGEESGQKAFVKQELSTKNTQGIESIKIVDKDEKPVDNEFALEENNLDSDELRNQGKYYAEFYLIVKGSKAFTKAKGKSVKITAEDRSFNNTKTESKVVLKPGAIHPFDMVGDLVKKTEGIEIEGEELENKDSFYAFVSWGKEPSEVSLTQLAIAMQEDPKQAGKLGGFFFEEIGEDIQKAETEATKRSKTNAVNTYGVACVATHIAGDAILGIMSLGVGLWSATFGIAVDCGIPYAIAMQEANGFDIPYISAALDATGDVIENTIGQIFAAAPDDNLGKRTVAAGVTATTARYGILNVKEAITNFLKATVEGETIDLSTLKSGNDALNKKLNEILEIDNKLKVTTITKTDKKALETQRAASAIEAENLYSESLARINTSFDDAAKKLEIDRTVLEKIGTAEEKEAINALKKSGITGDTQKSVTKTIKLLKEEKARLETIDIGEITRVEEHVSKTLGKLRASKIAEAENSISLAKKQRLRNFASKLSKSRYARLGLNFGVGILSNIAGLIAYNVSLKQGVEGQISLECGNEKLEDCKIKKDTLYEIAITRSKVEGKQDSITWKFDLTKEPKYPDSSHWLERYDDSFNRPLNIREAS